MTMSVPRPSDPHPATRLLAEATGPMTAVDAAIQPHIDRAVATLGPPDAVLSRMARYHLGDIAADGTDTSDEIRRGSRGKRLRPAVALLSCAAAGGEMERAAPAAAAIELLHQFTLIHDDIQDESPTRRHRDTVWAIWGVGQAINAGDSVHACAHIALYGLIAAGVDGALAMRLANAYDLMTIEIVRGQTRDLGFEGRDDVSPADYLDMISAKTSAILEYAAWAGALIAGGDEATADLFARFGLSLGIGFQIQDDLLGIWGDAAETGKAAADDIRRRKQSLPILLLRAAASSTHRDRLAKLYAAPEIDQDGVAEVLAMLERYGIRQQVEERVLGYHDDARGALLDATRPGFVNPGRDALLTMVDQLALRHY